MRNKQKGFSLIELLIVVAIILIIAAIAIPNLLRSKMAANEASAVASLRTLNTSIVAYSTTYGTDPHSFGNLDRRPHRLPLLRTWLTRCSAYGPPVKSGYTITYDAGGGTPVTTYTMTAVPVSSSTGQRYFFTDQSGVIRQTTDGPWTATVTSTPIGG